MLQHAEIHRPKILPAEKPWKRPQKNRSRMGYRTDTKEFRNCLSVTPPRDPRTLFTKCKKSVSAAEEQDRDKTHSKAEENSRMLVAEVQSRQKAISAPACRDEM